MVHRCIVFKGNNPFKNNNMSPKEDENGLKGFQFRQPVHKTKWQAVKLAIYNPSTQEFLGRTGKNWGKLERVRLDVEFNYLPV